MLLILRLCLVLNSYIPSYSPNLNLIERLWKFVKSELRTKYYDDFVVFKTKIDSIIKGVDKENKSIIDKLIGDKVQLFDDVFPFLENLSNTVISCTESVA